MSKLSINIDPKVLCRHMALAVKIASKPTIKPTKTATKKPTNAKTVI